MKHRIASSRSRKRGFVTADFAGQMLTRFVAANRSRIRSQINAQERVTLPTVLVRREELDTFYNLYENLIETICDAAQYGTTVGLEQNYSQYRNEVRAFYPSLKPFLAAYLGDDGDDVEAGIKATGRPLDAFELLVLADDLKSFATMDDGNMISRLTRTREALTRYSEHLRLLSERAA